MTTQHRLAASRLCFFIVTSSDVLWGSGITRCEKLQRRDRAHIDPLTEEDRDQFKASPYEI